MLNFMYSLCHTSLNYPLGITHNYDTGNVEFLFLNERKAFRSYTGHEFASFRNSVSWVYNDSTLSIYYIIATTFLRIPSYIMILISHLCDRVCQEDTLNSRTFPPFHVHPVITAAISASLAARLLFRTASVVMRHAPLRSRQWHRDKTLVSLLGHEKLPSVPP